MTTVVAGTFNRFHMGHEKLIDAAFANGDDVVIGLMSDKYVDAHKMKTVPFDVRKEMIERYIERMEYKNIYTINELSDHLGDSLTNKEYTHIVVSPETVRNAENINSERIKNGLKGMEIKMIPHELDESGQIINSSRILRGDITRTGYFTHRTIITMLGTAGGMASESRSSAGILIEYGKKKILFDCGPDTSKKIAEAHINVNDINDIFISHGHIDHFIGLPMLVMHQMMLHGRTEPVNIYIPDGVYDYLREIMVLYDIKIPFEIKFHEYSDGKVVECRDSFDVIPFRVEHSCEKAYGFRIIDPLKNKIIYTGDTQICDRVKEESMNADILIHDATYGSDHDGVLHGHSKVDGVVELAIASHVEYLILTHISVKYHKCMDKYVKTEEKEKLRCKGIRLIVPEDLYSLTL